MRSEPPPHPGLRGDPAQLRTGRQGRPRPAGSRAAGHTQQRTDRQLEAPLDPGVKLLPAPVVHADLATLVALAVTHEHRAAALVQIALGQRERFSDAQPRRHKITTKARTRRPWVEVPAWRITAP